MKSEVKDFFISFLRNKVSIKTFETWLYKSDELLESCLGKESYIKLLDINYSSKYVFDKLEPLLVEILEYNSIEEFMIKDLLTRLIYIDDDFIGACRQIYREYCNGYSFFRIIALKY